MGNTEKKTYISIKKVVLFMSRYRKETKRSMTFIVVVRLITIVSMMVVPLYYGQLIEVISDDVTKRTMAIALPILRSILGRNIGNQLSWRSLGYVMAKMEVKVMKMIYQTSFDYLHRHSYRFFTNNFAGSLLKKISKLVYGYESITDSLIFNLGAKGVTILLMIAFIVNEHMLLGAILAGWTVIFLFVQYRAYKSQMDFDQTRYEYDSYVTGFLADTISNNYTIACFGTQQQESASFEKILDKRGRLTQRSWLNKENIYIVNSVLMTGLEFLFIRLMVHAVQNNIIALGLFVAFQTYVLRLFHDLMFISNDLKRFFAAIGEAGEMIEILETEHEVVDHTSDSLVIAGGKVTFDAVDFDYGEGVALLRDFSLTIQPGEKIALVGPSGSGKSTIVKLLMRFLDIQQGSISIDGQDIAQVTQESLRGSMSIVPQDPYLFHRTLRENISYGKPDATMEEIVAAARLARCHDFISKLSQGYDTLVGERGIKLSGGERQRVAIARAILEDKKVLIMDEATSSLDSESEKMIQDAVHDLMQNKTAIVIAHRLSTIKEMDRIIVMKDGRIVEQGKHDTLLNMREGLYSKLRKIQAE